MNPTAGGASLLPQDNCDSGAGVEKIGPPAAGYVERWADTVNARIVNCILGAMALLGLTGCDHPVTALITVEPSAMSSEEVAAVSDAVRHRAQNLSLTCTTKAGAGSCASEMCKVRVCEWKRGGYFRVVLTEEPNNISVTVDDHVNFYTEGHRFKPLSLSIKAAVARVVGYDRVSYRLRS